MSQLLERDMKIGSYAVLAAVLVTAGCGTTAVNTVAGSNPQELPPELISLAAPGQDVSTARLLPSDNCYWYEHRGQVETTLLPLTTAAGSPICQKSQPSG